MDIITVPVMEVVAVNTDMISMGNSFSTFEKLDKVLVGLSGGVDSSVSIQILRDQGFEVSAAVIRFSNSHDPAVEAAKKVAEQLNVVCYEIDAREAFESKVINPFCDSYCTGKTPNPCVLCNPNVKFKMLSQKADELGIRFIATGHYARVKEQPDGSYAIAIPESAARDQSYMLYRLDQSILSRLILPLGEFQKQDVRDTAKEMGLASADAPDSQEICFIPDGDYAKFIQNRGMESMSGNFIGPEGQNLGAHKGVAHYTIGQRKGLNIALGKPVFVKSIQSDGNILLGWAGDEFYKEITLQDFCTPTGNPLQTGEYLAKIRSAAKPASCLLTYNENGNIVLQFSEPVRAPAPGQSAVLYQNNCVVGGGFIDNIIS